MKLMSWQVAGADSGSVLAFRTDQRILGHRQELALLIGRECRGGSCTKFVYRFKRAPASGRLRAAAGAAVLAADAGQARLRGLSNPSRIALYNDRVTDHNRGNSRVPDENYQTATRDSEEALRELHSQADLIDIMTEPTDHPTQSVSLGTRPWRPSPMLHTVSKEALDDRSLCFGCTSLV